MKLAKDHITVWPFDKAPEEIQKIASQGGDEVQKECLRIISLIGLMLLMHVTNQKELNMKLELST